MYEKMEECPSCKYTKFSNFIICKDHSVTQESFALVHCDKCGLIFTNPRPDTASIGQYYESKDYISHTNSANNPINLAYKMVRWYTLKQKVSLITKFSNQKNILDFGCGSGVFVKHLLKNGFNAHGYEPHPTANAIAKKNTNGNIVQKLKEFKKKDSYDIITAWHVLEHAHELKATLKTMRKLIPEDGVIFIAVPNMSSYDAAHYKQDWAGYDVPRHLYHFNRNSFTYLAKKCKLKVIDIKPMKFDAYYVSMLSERYQTGKLSLLNALKVGVKSNKLAQTSNEYSSLIYVLSR